MITFKKILNRKYIGFRKTLRHACSALLREDSLLLRWVVSVLLARFNDSPSELCVQISLSSSFSSTPPLGQNKVDVVKTCDIVSTLLADPSDVQQIVLREKWHA